MRPSHVATLSVAPPSFTGHPSAPLDPYSVTAGSTDPRSMDVMRSSSIVPVDAASQGNMYAAATISSLYRWKGIWKMHATHIGEEGKMIECIVTTGSETQLDQACVQPTLYQVFWWLHTIINNVQSNSQPRLVVPTTITHDQLNFLVSFTRSINIAYT